ncbi:MAG: peptidoglycan-binding protein [Burkholderiales bacterium]|nr:peptidoglycan-binding protein [Burkholderiales bacterium]
MNAAHAHDASTVRSLQAALRERGFDPGPVDGVWGPQTEDALRDFQQSLGLAASGQPDAQTMSALDVRAPLASGGMRDVDGTASSPAVR